MGTSDYILLLVVVFFGLMLHAVHRDDKRKQDRRQEVVPVRVERRSLERRQRRLGSYLAWALRAPWGKRNP